ncbi:unnamed protein product [Dovyalis caffra]|uniref:Uncharacterized protein n=1 Tax=Dovyalis caffra TaxID=77055 RepID=A0AAV1S4F7_9ROSI|nr:unnamed protein product [Dovyalis caffra]
MYTMASFDMNNRKNPLRLRTESNCWIKVDYAIFHQTSKFQGFFFVVIGWPISGMIFEGYGLFMLFSGFWPTLSIFLQRVPVLGWILQLPFVRSLEFGNLVAGFDLIGGIWLLIRVHNTEMLNLYTIIFSRFKVHEDTVTVAEYMERENVPSCRVFELCSSEILVALVTQTKPFYLHYETLIRKFLDRSREDIERRKKEVLLYNMELANGGSSLSAQYVVGKLVGTNHYVLENVYGGLPTKSRSMRMRRSVKQECDGERDNGVLTGGWISRFIWTASPLFTTSISRKDHRAK